MAYQPIWDGVYDLAIKYDEIASVLEEVMKHKMVVVGWVTEGPAGGNPMITLRGTRRQHMAWLRYYDEGQEMIGQKDDGVAFDDDEAWHEYREMGFLTFVA